MKNFQTDIQVENNRRLTMWAKLKDIEKRTESLINAKNSKHRMVQITNYEYERYYKQY